jgi:hypothetical protein
MMFWRKALAVAVIGDILAGMIVERAMGQVDSQAPLSSMVAITHEKNKSIVGFVKSKVEAYAFGDLDGYPFPLEPGTDDTIRVVKGLRSNVVVKWLDPLTSSNAVTAPRYGAPAVLHKNRRCGQLLLDLSYPPSGGELSGRLATAGRVRLQRLCSE